MQGKQLLNTWLKRVMKVKLTDGRTVIGVFMCTDADCNLILGQCREFRTLDDPVSEENSTSKTSDYEEPRILGLAMVPGQHIVSICIDATTPSNEDDVTASAQSNSSSKTTENEISSSGGGGGDDK